MRGFSICFGLAIALAMRGGDPAYGQLFGPRTEGQTLSRQPRPGLSEAGSLRGNERFIRGARRRGDFVGGDARDRRTFVGAQSGAGAARPSGDFENPGPRPTAGVAEQPTPSPSARAPLYDPRLVVGFSFDEPTSTERQRNLAAHLQEALWPETRLPIEVLLAGDAAVLRGAVESEEVRLMAAGLALLEPGVATVRNELLVRLPGTLDENAAPAAPPAAPQH